MESASSRIRHIFFGLGACCLAASPAWAAVDVCAANPDGVIGEEPEGVTWTAANSPYIVTCDLNIAQLTVEPGVVVDVQANVVLSVSGRLTAVGEAARPITFTSSTGTWKGLLFDHTQPGSELVHCIVEKANTSGARFVETIQSVEDSIFRDNSSTTGNGGGVSIDNQTTGGVFEILRCRFEDNTAKGHGGGMAALMGPGRVTVERCLVQGNRTNPSGSGNTVGGGIYVSADSAIVRGSWIENNACRGSGTHSAARGGGLYLGGPGSIDGRHRVSNCIVRDNSCTSFGSRFSSATAQGGGIYAGSGTHEFELTNSVVAFNTMSTSVSNGSRVREGGGIYIHAEAIGSVVNATIWANNYEGIYSGASGAANVTSSILYYNAGVEANGNTTVTYSCIQDPFPGAGNHSYNPGIGVATDFRIVPGSPCVDAGNPDPTHDDVCFPPSLGTPRNDMGAHGGPGGCDWSFPFDCDGNGVLDSDDIAAGRLRDCNANGIADTCEIADGTATDSDGDGLLDECVARMALFEAVPGEALCYDLVVRSDVPFRGGEFAVGVDPALLTVVSAAVATGAPTPLASASELRISPADPGSEPLLACDGEPRAGVVLGWVNSNGGTDLIPAGEHHLFRLCLAFADGAPVRDVGVLDFLFCLDPGPGFPVTNAITGEDVRTIPLLPVPESFPVANFHRGDANDDGLFDISDPVSIFVHIFLGEVEIGCPDAADANDDGLLDMTDGIGLLEWRFLGALPPAAPFPACGRDPTDELTELGCAMYRSCF